MSSFSFRCIPIHVICQNLGRNKAKALTAFHAFTGSDSTSSFFGKGKKTAWSTWMAYPDVTPRFLAMSCPSPPHPSDVPVAIQKYVVKLYGLSEKEISNVDSARLHLILYHGKQFQNIPPSSDALYQKVLCTTYQVKIFQIIAKIGWLNYAKPVLALFFKVLT